MNAEDPRSTCLASLGADHLSRIIPPPPLQVQAPEEKSGGEQLCGKERGERHEHAGHSIHQEKRCISDEKHLPVQRAPGTLFSSEGEPLFQGENATASTPPPVFATTGHPPCTNLLRRSFSVQRS